MEQANWRQRRDILICIICVGVILWVGWNLLGKFVEPVLLLLLSMTVAFLISPAVDLLERLKIPRLLGTIMVYIVIVAMLAGFFYALTSSLIHQTVSLSDTITRIAYSIPDRFTGFIKFLRTTGGIPQSNIDDAVSRIVSVTTDFAQTAATNAPNILLSISNVFLDIIIVFVISFYLTLDGKRIRDNIIKVTPQRSKATVLLFEDALNRVVGNYIRGQLTLAFIIGILVALVCTITGLGQFALIFGMLGFLFETIPMVGPGLASIFPLLASLLLPDPFPRTIYVLICFVIIQTIESNILGPRIVGHAVGLHPVASIMALLVFARLFGDAFGAFGGAMGALIATPLAAAAWVVIASIYRSVRGESADEMLAHKRAPWTIPRPGLPANLRLRRSNSHHGGHEVHKSSRERLYSPVPAHETENRDQISTEHTVVGDDTKATTEQTDEYE